MIIYLAAPYWSKDRVIRLHRFEQINDCVAQLLLQGHIVFSPISHSHPVQQHMPNQSRDFWLRQDKAMFDVCDELWVLRLPGWDRSVGVRYEIEWAEAVKKPIMYLVPGWVREGLYAPKERRCNDHET